MRGSRARRARGIIAVIAAPLAGCEFDRVTVESTRPVPVVHAVLNPVVREYTVLVEELLTGSLPVLEDVPFNPADPIRTGVGIPISGALVTITREDGASGRGVEDVLNGVGTGVYRFTNGSGGDGSSLAIIAGASYALRVVTPMGVTVAGSTRVPIFLESPVLGLREFDRERDTLTLVWPAVEGARRYLVRAESPRGPFGLFAHEPPFRVPGTLRNFRSPDLPSVFVPGFSQRVMVAAVDSNYYDYYRTANDPFNGRGLISRIEGGIGLFGALVPLSSTTLRVIAPQDAPHEGRFGTDAAPRGPYPAAFLIYEAGRAGGIIQLSGQHESSSGAEGLPFIGTLVDDRISLALLRSQTFSDTSRVMSGRFAGDSLLLRITGPDGPTDIVYRRR